MNRGYLVSMLSSIDMSLYSVDKLSYISFV